MTEAVARLCAAAALAFLLSLYLLPQWASALPGSPSAASVAGFAVLAAALLARTLLPLPVFVAAAVMGMLAPHAAVQEAVPAPLMSLFLFALHGAALMLIGAASRLRVALLPAALIAMVALVVAANLTLGLLQLGQMLLPISGASRIAHLLLSTGILAAALARLGTLPWQRRHRLILGSLGLFVLVGCVSFSTLIWRDHAKSVAGLEVQAANIAHLLEEHAHRSFDPVNLVLNRVEEVVAAEGVMAASHSKAHWLRIRKMVDELPQLSSVGIIDASGTMHLLTTRFPLEPLDFSYREYFAAHRDGAERFLGKLIIAGTTKKPIFTLSQRLVDADGAFAGVVLASLDAAYFEQFYESLRLGPDAALALFRADGRPVVRNPLTPDLHERDFSSIPLFTTHLPARPIGSFVGVSPFDGSTKILGYRKAESLPLVVAAALDVAPVASAFEMRAVEAAAILLAAYVILGIAAHLQINASRREEQAMRRLSESRDFADSVLNSVSSHIAIIGADGRIVATNRAWDRFAEQNGLQPGAAGRGVSYTAATRLAAAGEAEDAALAQAAEDGIAAVRAGRMDEFTLNYPCHAPGEQRWFTMRATRLKGSAGHVVVSHENVTRLKLVERSLEQAKSAAEAASQAKSEFIANMSHEIRTPLNAVLGLSHLLAQTEQTPRQRDLTQKIRIAGGALLAIVNDVLDLAKIESGKLQLDEAAFRLDTVFDDLRMVLSNEADRKGVALDFAIAPEVPIDLLGDGARLQQVLYNLVGNGIKFTEHGSVRVRAELEAMDGAEIVLALAVTDTGIGISPEHLGKLFSAFSQADGSISRRHGGTGLGLAISSRLVGAMGGRIAVESVAGEGSTFRFTVALRRHDGAASDALGVDETVSLRGLTILVVEDNLINQEVARDVLLRNGAEVCVAASGEEAVAIVKAARQQIDAILMDVQMPGMDGLETTRAIRALPRLEPLPIIAVTAHAMVSDRGRCLDAGMDDYLPKPIDPDQLVAVLLRWTGRSRGPVETPKAAVPAPAPAPAPPSRRTALDAEAAMQRLGGNAPLYERLLRNLMPTVDASIAAADEALSHGDAEALRRAAHTLKGAADNLGAVAVAEAARALQAAADAGADAADGLERLRRARHELAAALQARLAPPTQQAEAERDEDLPARLAELAGLLQQRAFDSVEAFDRLRPAIERRLGPQRTATLARLVETMQFPAAAAFMAAELGQEAAPTP